MKFSYLIFDFDGTLANTTGAIIHAYRTTYAAMGLPIPTDEQIRSYIGLVMKEVFLRTVKGATLEDAEKAVAIYRAEFARMTPVLTTTFPGVIPALTILQNMGYRMSIATSRSHTTLEDMVRDLGLEQFFELTIGSEDVVNHKPAPDTVNLILDKLSLNPSEVLVIGDASYDIQMAHSAGCKACGITWGNQSREQLLATSPEYLIDNLSQLIAILGISILNQSS